MKLTRLLQLLCWEYVVSATSIWCSISIMKSHALGPQDSGLKDRTNPTVKHLYHSLSCLCLPGDSIFTYKYLKIKCWIPIMNIWIYIFLFLTVTTTKYFYSFLPLYPRSKYMLSSTGLGKVVKLTTWSFPDDGLQKRIESVRNMGCILETV